MGRTRSEFVLHDASSVVSSVDVEPSVRRVQHADREALASLLLDAYRGTVDDEGEGDEEALVAVDMYFVSMEWGHSMVLEHGRQLVAMSFVVRVNGRRYIDPVATMASFKGRGLGRAVVLASLRSLLSCDVHEVGAVITDGNTPSERLFAGLGFVRNGTWG